MARRSDESQMDYEFENKTGPMDATSPWARAFTPSQDRGQTANGTRKRNYNSFQSPTKPFSSNDVFGATSPSSAFFGGNPRPSSPSKLDGAAFKTPRKLKTYDSSDINTSPEYNADSDATPDTSLRGGMHKTQAMFTHLMDQGRVKDAKYARLEKPASGRGEFKPHSRAAEKRVQKRKREEGDRRLARRKGSSSSDEEDHTAPAVRQPAAAPAAPGALHQLFHFIETHPGLPHVLSYYVQLLLNVFLGLSLVYLAWSFWATIRADVDLKSEEAMVGILAEMAACAAQYRDNRCAPAEARAPALEPICANWERCMNRDPKAVGRARVSAHTFAEIFNSFIEPISWKAMSFSLILLLGCALVSNLPFYIFRNKILPQDHAYHTAQPQPTPQSTPFRIPNQYEGGVDYWAQPYQHQQYLGSPMRGEPAPSGPYGAAASGVDGNVRDGSPVRRLQHY